MLHIDHIRKINSHLEFELENKLLVDDIDKKSDEEIKKQKIMFPDPDHDIEIQAYLEFRKMLKELEREKTQMVHFAVSKMEPFNYLDE